MPRFLLPLMVCAICSAEGDNTMVHADDTAGANRREDPARSDPHVFFFEDFESGTHETHFQESSRRENRSLVSGDTVFDGRHSLRFSIRGGGHDGGSLSFVFSRAGLPEPDELYGRYYLRFGATWDPGRGGKLPGPSGTYNRAGWGGRRVDGTDGWSARMGFETSRVRPEETQIYYYTYHADMAGRYGSNFHWNLRGLGSLRKDVWYCIETYVHLNSPGRRDGILRGWVDGELAMEKTDLRFRDTAELKIEKFWMNLYYGGSWEAPHDMDIFLDNVALSTHPIGRAR